MFRTIGVIAGSLFLALSVHASQPAAVPYHFTGVRVGGGGYVSGLLFHPAVRGLSYARTDVGGAYRRDTARGQWVPLLDWITAKDENLLGIDSFAVDPSDPQRLYLAAGTYTTPQAGNAAILRSDDQGRYFERIDLPFKLGGNELGRGNGERLAVDPNDGRVFFWGRAMPGCGAATTMARIGRRWTASRPWPPRHPPARATPGAPSPSASCSWSSIRPVAGAASRRR